MRLESARKSRSSRNAADARRGRMNSRFTTGLKMANFPTSVSFSRIAVPEIRRMSLCQHVGVSQIVPCPPVADEVFVKFRGFN